MIALATMAKASRLQYSIGDGRRPPEYQEVAVANFDVKFT